MSLATMRVLDLSHGVAGSYCTKLLADAGAEVVMVESPAGSPLRTQSRGTRDESPLFQYLAAGKRSVIGESEDLVDLVADADLLVEDRGPGALDIDELRSANPRLIVVSISPFGHTGPYAMQPATEFTLQSWCGSSAARGEPERSPLQAGGGLGEWASGVHGALGGVAAWSGSRATGCGEHVDVSMLEVMVRTYHPAGLLEKQLGLPWRGRYHQIPTIVPTLDGWAGLFLMQRQHFVDLMHLVGRPDLAESDMWDMSARFARREELLEAVHAWSMENTTETIVDLCNALRLPATNVGTGKTLQDIEQFRANGVFVTNPSGGFVQPRVPFRMGDDEVREILPSPKVGELSVLRWRDRAPHQEQSQPASFGDLPLKGVRILDLTAYWAGPECTDILGALGADVIKVESPQRPDSLRFVNVVRPDDARWWEFNGLYHSVNRNKRDVTLDLGRPEGHEIVKRLIATSDIVIENMTPRVLDKLGLGWDAIHELNDRTILARMPAFGLAGPWQNRGGFGPTMEQVTGMASVTGYKADEPVVTGGACDAVAGAHAAFAVLAALESRGEGGGMLLEIPMVESMLNVAAEVVIEFSAHGRLLTPVGNRSRSACPQGTYRCVGEDDWVSLSIVDEHHWAALLDVIDAPAWLRAEERLSLEGRREVEDSIDDLVGAWSSELSAADAHNELLSRGVPSAVVTRTHDLESLEQLQARRFLEPVEHPVAGRMLHPGIAFRFASRKDLPWIRLAPPTLGQHNREVLASIGVTDEELVRLQEIGIISDRLGAT